MSVVVPFRRPSQALQASVAEPPVAAGHDRLAQALAALDAALAQQREAVNAWREALGDLSETMQGLGGSVSRLQNELGFVGSQAEVLRGHALDLRRTAERMEAIS